MPVRLRAGSGASYVHGTRGTAVLSFNFLELRYLTSAAASSCGETGAHWTEYIDSESCRSDAVTLRRNLVDPELATGNLSKA